MRRGEALACKAAEVLSPLRSRFEGRTVLVFASGPSLPGLWEGRSSDLPKIAVNDAYKIVAGADILYSCDGSWWKYYKGVPDFDGIRVTFAENLSVEAPFPGAVQVVESGQTGYDERLGYVRHGYNSGHAATHLAAQLGAKKIALVGFDMHGSHFFGDHPKEIRVPLNFPLFIQCFEILGEELSSRGIEVVNATPGSALKCFPLVQLADVLS